MLRKYILRSYLLVMVMTFLCMAEEVKFSKLHLEMLKVLMLKTIYEHCATDTREKGVEAQLCGTFKVLLSRIELLSLEGKTTVQELALPVIHALEKDTPGIKHSLSEKNLTINISPATPDEHEILSQIYGLKDRLEAGNISSQNDLDQEYARLLQSIKNLHAVRTSTEKKA